MNFLPKFARIFIKKIKRSKPSSSAIPKNSVDTKSRSWVYNPEAFDLYEPRRFESEDLADSYENPNTLGSFDPNPGSASLDYDNKIKESETTNRMDDSLSAIASESLLQAEIERLQEELERKTKENNSLREQLKRRPDREVNNLTTVTPSLAPPPPPPPPPPALFQIVDPLQALKEQNAKSGKNNPIKTKENKGQKELLQKELFLNELVKATEKRRLAINLESES